MTGARFKPYPAYKDSGVKWLGQIPAHWEIRRLKNVVDLRNEKVFSIDSGKPYIGMENVESWTGRLLDTDLEVTGAAGTFEAGDVLFGKLRPYLAKAMRASTSGQCSSEFLVIKPKAVLGRFFHLLVLSKGFVCTVDSATYGTKMPRANWETVGGIGISIPEDDEQQAIADFLDRETAKIDALVEKKERLIKLLKEKRTALITRAVTKGLDPNVSMKDSVIEWLGQIPEHWETTSVRYQFTNLDHKRIPIANEDRALLEKIYPYYGASGIIDRVDSYLFDGPLVLVAEDGANLLSRSTPLAFLATGKYWVNNHAHILDPLTGDICYWIGVLQTYDYTPLISGAAQPKLTGDRLGSIRIPLPPDSEQREIAGFVDRKTAKIDALINKIQEAVERLKEYRTALISAAVTGKIDVRESTVDPGWGTR